MFPLIIRNKNAFLFKAMKTTLPAAFAAILLLLLPGKARSLSVEPYKVQAFVTPEGKIHVVVENPGRLRYKVELRDQRDRSLYEEYTNLTEYRRKLDIVGIPGQGCEVSVRIGEKHYRFRVYRREAETAFSMDAPTAPKQRMSPEKDSALFTLHSTVEENRAAHNR